MTSEKTPIATGGKEVTEEERKILEAFHKLPIKPIKMENPDDLLAFMESVKDLKVSSGSTKTTEPEKEATKMKGNYHFPKLSNFHGDDNKGDVNWETFKFEVDSLMEDNFFSEEQILLGVRRAVKGTASDIIRRLGTGITIKDIMDKLESTFGNIETRESILRKFYSTAQLPKESINNYSSRLEEIYTQEYI